MGSIEIHDLSNIQKLVRKELSTFLGIRDTHPLFEKVESLLQQTEPYFLFLDPYFSLRSLEIRGRLITFLFHEFSKSIVGFYPPKVQASAFFFTGIDASFERIEEEILRKVFQQKRRIHQSQNGRIRKRGRRWKWFKKDNTCGLCGTKIERYSQSSLDHIVPVSRGGSNSITNLRLTHIRCNRIKADRLDEELGQEFLTYPLSD